MFGFVNVVSICIALDNLIQLPCGNIYYAQP